MILAAAESLLNFNENIHNCFFIRSKNAIISFNCCAVPFSALRLSFRGQCEGHLRGNNSHPSRNHYRKNSSKLHSKNSSFFKGKRLTPFQPQKDIYVNIFEAIVGAIFSPLISVRELIKKLTMPDYETNVRLYLNLTNFLHLLIVPGGIEK